MQKSLIHLVIFLIAFNGFTTFCYGLDQGDYGTIYETRAYNKPTFNFASAFDEYNSDRGLGISAWGIVAVAVSIILAIIGMYYISICYPVFCSKPKKFDTMPFNQV